MKSKKGSEIDEPEVDESEVEEPQRQKSYVQVHDELPM